jgi:hypothetical protein
MVAKVQLAASGQNAKCTETWSRQKHGRIAIAHPSSDENHKEAETAALSSVGFMEDCAIDIRPELFRAEGAEIQQGVRQPALSNLCPGAVLGWIVGR